MCVLPVGFREGSVRQSEKGSIVVPGRKSGFRAGLIGRISVGKGIKISPPTGLRPAGGPISTLSRFKWQLARTVKVLLTMPRGSCSSCGLRPVMNTEHHPSAEKHATRRLHNVLALNLLNSPMKEDSVTATPATGDRCCNFCFLLLLAVFGAEADC